MALKPLEALQTRSRTSCAFQFSGGGGTGKKTGSSTSNRKEMLGVLWMGTAWGGHTDPS